MPSNVGRSGRLPPVSRAPRQQRGEQRQPAAAELGGEWVSTISSEFVGLELRQAGSHVTGHAELAPGGSRASYQVRGFLRGAQLSVSLFPDTGGGAIAVRGTLARDTLKIRLDGGGFTDRLVPLVRME
jgi:hypothetical protein